MNLQHDRRVRSKQIVKVRDSPAGQYSLWRLGGEGCVRRNGGGSEWAGRCSNRPLLVFSQVLDHLSYRPAAPGRAATIFATDPHHVCGILRNNKGQAACATPGPIHPKPNGRRHMLCDSWRGASPCAAMPRQVHDPET